MPKDQQRRALRMMVWGSRAAGWVLIALAVMSAPRIGALLHLGGGLSLFSSLALGVLAVAWLVGLELFLRFFDKFLSRN